MGDSALSPVTVLDLGRVLAAPLAAQLLADFGARVIKVERPGAGDEFRHTEPKMNGDHGESTADSAYFASCNRNKESVTVDIKTAEGQSLIRELAGICDVLIENFKVGDLARSGLDYETLSKVCPRLIYCSVTGYGQSGPYALWPAYDPVLQAMGGLMAVTGTPGEGDGSGPAKVGPSIIDIVTAMTAANAILAALAQRERTGQGQYIDVSLLDSGIAMMSHLAVMYLSADQVPRRLGTDSNGNAPSGMFRCADGSIMIVSGNEAQFRRLCTVIGGEHLLDDPRFRTRETRVANIVQLRPAIETYLGQLNVDEALKRLAEVNVPAGRFNEFPEVFKDPQVVHREMVVTVPHPEKSDLRLVSRAAKMSDSKANYRPPPLLGEHTVSVLRDLLGKSEDEIEKLRRSGAI